MRIAIMGIRGIPANYGGFETFAEELASRLVDRGHDVTVYGRTHSVKHDDRYYKGARIVLLPTIRHKYFDTVVHTFLCTLHSLTEDYDVVLICNSANSAFAFIPRLAGQKIALNVDGLEWKRKKWNKLGKWFYRISEILATVTANEIVTDSKVIKKYYWEKFRKKSTFIPYGGPLDRENSQHILKKFGLLSRGYLLYVSRFEPENNAHVVIEAFEKVETDLKLVMVGDAPYNDQYIQRLKQTRDPRIVFTGYVFGKGYRELQSHAYLYIQATEVGGTHPALLEGMGFGNCVLANDVPEHREVLSDAGFYFDAGNPDDLRRKIQYLVDNEEVVIKYRKYARARIRSQYTWDEISRRYELLFASLVDRRNGHL